MKNTVLFVYRRIVNHLIEIFEKNGVNAWWTLPEDQLLPPEFIEEARKTQKPLPTKVSSAALADYLSILFRLFLSSSKEFYFDGSLKTVGSIKWKFSTVSKKKTQFFYFFI